ncbi:hypothetical protein Tco_0646480 [Tanacetum coccineum]
MAVRRLSLSSCDGIWAEVDEDEQPCFFGGSSPSGRMNLLRINALDDCGILLEVDRFPDVSCPDLEYRAYSLAPGRGRRLAGNLVGSLLVGWWGTVGGGWDGVVGGGVVVVWLLVGWCYRLEDVYSGLPCRLNPPGSDRMDRVNVKRMILVTSKRMIHETHCDMR